jgi:hypothetical protein
MDVCATTPTTTAATAADEEKNVGVEGDNSPTVLLWCVMNLPIKLSTVFSLSPDKTTN